MKDANYVLQWLKNKLDFYWLNNPEDEYKVRITLDFMKADGQTTSKLITYENPLYFEKGIKEPYEPNTKDSLALRGEDWWHHGEITKYAKYSRRKTHESN